VFEVHAFEQRADQQRALAPVGDALEAREVLQRLLGRQRGVEAELLRQVAEHSARRGLPAHEVHAADADAPPVGFEQRGEDFHERRLPRPVRPQEPKETPGLDIQRDSVQRQEAIRVRFL
jgi:hypothetical protein